MNLPMHRAMLLLAAIVAGLPAWAYEPRDGDIVFQDPQAPESEAIRLATGSPYSHVGVVFAGDGEPVVWEAVNPVQATPFREWAARGREGHFVAKRLVDAEEVLADGGAQRLRRAVAGFAGRPYDFHFSWSNDALYCSELVWKAFDQALGVRLSDPRPMADYDLAHPQVRARLRERFGAEIPLDEQVVSPAALYDSPRLQTVYGR